MNNKEKFDNLIKCIHWENWQKETEQCDEQIEYFDLCEVLYSKIEYLKENIVINIEEEEHYDTLTELQLLLSLLSEKKIKSIL